MPWLRAHAESIHLQLHTTQTGFEMIKRTHSYFRDALRPCVHGAGLILLMATVILIGSAGICAQVFPTPDNAADALDPHDFASLGDLVTGQEHIRIDTDNLTIRSFQGIAANDGSGNMVAVFCFDSVLLGLGTTIEVVGDRPLAILSKGHFYLNSILDVSGGVGDDYKGQNGGSDSGQGVGRGGEVDYLSNGPGGGAGHAGHGGSGVGNTRQPGGIIYGDKFARALAGGSGGGRGLLGNAWGGGGAGGGAVLLAALGKLTIGPSGAVLAEGAEGSAGYIRASGGGSGGTIILRSRRFEGDATAKVSVKGGRGGNGEQGLGPESAGGGGSGGRILLMTNHNSYSGEWDKGLGAGGRDRNDKALGENGGFGSWVLKPHSEWGNDIPKINAGFDITVTTDAALPFSRAIDIRDPLDTVTVSLISPEMVNSGATLSPASGFNSFETVLNWTPPAPGTYSGTIRAVDSQGAIADIAIQITAIDWLTCGPHAEVYHANVGKYQKVEIVGQAPAGEPLTVTPSGLPPGAILNIPTSGVAPLTVTFQWTPQLGDVGLHNVTLQFTNSTGLSTDCNFAVSVVNLHPKIEGGRDLVEIHVGGGARLKRSIWARDEDPGDTLTYQVRGLPAGATLIPLGSVPYSSPLGFTLIWETEPGDLGVHNFWITVRDSAGNEDTCNFRIIVDDVTVPEILGVKPDDGTCVSTSSISFKATVKDANEMTVVSTPAGINTSLDPGQSIVSGILALANEGPNTIGITVTDGGTNQSSAAVVVIRDSEKPRLSVLSPAANAVLGSNVPVKFTVRIEDRTPSKLDINGTSLDVLQSADPETTFNEEIVMSDVTLAPGANLVEIVAVDCAGNETRIWHPVTVDFTAPIVTIDSPTSTTGTPCFGPGESPIAVTATIDDISTTTVSSNPAGVNGSLPGGGGIVSGSVGLVEGSNVITVEAEDAGGLSSSDSITVIYDTTGPDATFTSPADGDIMRGTIDWDAEVTDATPGSGVASVEFFVDGASTPFVAFTSGPFEAQLDTTTLTARTHTLSILAPAGQGTTTS